ncbi:MAG: glycosyltransferase family 9 protein [Chloroflexota bacterium]|nr:glycosyltransferase family 9 protein [Chloroflexota bacterium]
MMNIKQKAKRQIRGLFLHSLRRAARPVLRYRATPPDLAKPPQRLLVLRPDHLGDLLMTTPALSLLRHALPKTEITALVGPWGAASLQNNSDVDNIVRCEFPGFSREPKANPFAPYLYALEQSRILRQSGYEAAINFRYDFWWGALLTYLADIPVRIGYDWPEAHSFLTHRLPFQAKSGNFLPSLNQLPNFGQPSQHSAALNLALAHYTLQQYQINSDPYLSEQQITRMKYYPAAEDLRYVNLNLSEWGVGRKEKVVVIHPGSGATLKLWTVEGFAAVADALAERYNTKVVLAGGEGESVLLKNIVKTCQSDPLHWETSGGFGRLAALFARCDLVIGLDSGPLHLAVAVGTPTIHLFGPTDPTIFGPWGDPTRHRIVRTDVDLPCCPCGVLDFERGCWKGGYCLRTIKVSQVLQVVEELLEKR